MFLLTCNLALCPEIVPLTNLLTLTTHSAKQLLKANNSMLYYVASAQVLTDSDTNICFIIYKQMLTETMRGITRCFFTTVYLKG